MKACLAAISFIVSQAAKWRVPHEALNTDLQQLGLPKENSDGISRPYRIHWERLLAKAEADTISPPRAVACTFQCDTVLASSRSDGVTVDANTVHVQLTLADVAARASMNDAPVPTAVQDTQLLRVGGAAAVLAQSFVSASNAAGGSLPSGHRRAPTVTGAIGALAAPEVMAAHLEYAMAGLGIAPICTPSGAVSAGGASSATTPSETTAEAGGPRRTSTLSFAMSKSQAQHLLQQLKVARQFMSMAPDNVRANVANAAPPAKTA
ncbi:hypothetical protein EON67_10725 [archaeon]|nr:MAG: hypothetical protein EON67_10725 [archaeon]